MEGPDTIRRRKRQRRIRAMEVPLDEGSCAVGHKGKEEDGGEGCMALNAAAPVFLYRPRSRAAPFSLFFHA